MCTLLAVCLSGLEDEIIDDIKRHVYSAKRSRSSSNSSVNNRHVRFEVLSVQTSSTHSYNTCNNDNKNNSNNNRSSSTVRDHDGCIGINGKNLYQGEAGCGKILIYNVMDYSFINYVRSVQHWFIYVTHSYDIHTSSQHGRESIQAALTGGVRKSCINGITDGDSDNSGSVDVDWEQCVSYWKEALRVVKRVATTNDSTRDAGN